MAEIKQIKVGSTDYDIAAKYLLDNNGNNKSWEDILSASFSIKVVWTNTDYASTTAPTVDKLATIPAGVEVHYNNGTDSETGTLTASADTQHTLYLIYEKNSFYEYATTYNGSTYSWEKIGSTDIDLANYQQLGKILTSTGPSSNSTGSAGEQTATVSGTVKYTKAATVTGSAGSTDTSNTSEYAGTSVSVTGLGFSGTKATLSLSTDYTPAGTISKPNVNLTSSGKTVVTGGDTTSVLTGVEASGTTTVVTGVGADGTASVVKTAIKSAALSTGTTATAGYVAYVASATYSAASLGTASTTIAVTGVTGGTASLTTKNVGFTNTTSNVMYSPTVTSGVLSWFVKDAATQDVLSSTGASASSTATVITGYPNFSGGEFTPTTKYATVTTADADDKATVLTGVKASSTATVLTGVQASGATDAYTSLSTTTVNHVTGAALSAAPTFTGTSATISLSTEYTPQGSVTGGSVAIPKHSHTYVSLPAHTHSVDKTDNVEATISLSAAVSAHTHDLGNHTHNVVTTNN